MVDLPSRIDIEEELTRVIARDFAAFRRRVLEVTGERFVNIDSLNQEVWDEGAAALSADLRPALNNVFVTATDAMADNIGYSLSWDVVNERAQLWAYDYTFDLVRGINATSQTRLRSIVTQYFEGGTLGEATDAIAVLFGGRRAEMIAVTEITRAATEGERWAADEVRAAGIALRAIHQTNIDDRVCPICGPRHGLEIIDGRYPPLHPRCRCWVNHEPILDEVVT